MKITPISQYWIYSLFFFFYFLSLSAVFAQSNSRFECAQEKLHQNRLASDANYREKQAQLEKSTYQKSIQPSLEKSNELLGIPVVIHIIHLSEDAIPQDETSNPTDQQIFTAIQHLNEAFSNTASYAGDSRGANDANNPDAEFLKSVDNNIVFCLAKRDINGMPTNGVLRYENNQFSDLDQDVEDDEMKRWVAEQNGNSFPTTDYANVYLVDRICDNEDGGLGCGIAGYAYLAGAHGEFYDGVVNEAFWFGSSTTRSTVHIHEFGHYLNLAHTFDGGCKNDDCLLDGDRVCDTPPDDSNDRAQCDEFENSCDTDTLSGPFTVDQEDLFENYMDYSNSACQNTYTQGQKDRMRLALQSTRASLLNSKGCIPLSDREVALNRIILPNSLICTADFVPILQVENLGSTAINNLEIESSIDGVNTINTLWEGTILPDETAAISLELSSVANFGSYEFCSIITAVNGVEGDGFLDNNEACTNFNYENALSNPDFCEDFTDISTNQLRFLQPLTSDSILQIIGISSCASNEGSAVVLNSWRSDLNENDIAILQFPILNLSQLDAPKLYFDRSYTLSFSNANTTLRVLASTDCGVTTDTIYERTSVALATRLQSVTDRTWIPASCEDWQMDSIDLSAYTGENAVLITLEMSATAEDQGFFTWGNNLYLDNVCLKGEICTPLNSNLLDSDTCVDIAVEVDSSQLGTEEIVGWLITKDSLPENVDKNTLSPLLETVVLDGDITTDNTVLLASNVGDYGLQIPSPCSNLEAGQKLYLTPFISQNLAAVEDVNFQYTDGNYFTGRFNSQSARFYETEVPLPEIPLQIVNDPIFSITIDITAYESDSSNIRFLIQQTNFDLNTPLREVINQEGNIGTYVIQQDQLPNFDPKFGFKIWVFSDTDINELEWNIVIDVLYSGRAASVFPTLAAFNDCAIGNTLVVECDCNSCDLTLGEIGVKNILDCDGSGGFIGIGVLGEDTENLEYSLDGENWQTEAAFDSLAAGTYTPMVRSTEIENCRTSGEEVNISEPDTPEISEIASAGVSDCGNTDGTISVLAAGSENIEYSLDNTNWQASNQFENLEAATYTVYVRNADAPNCVHESSPLEIAMPETPAVTSFESQDISDCGLNDGVIRINIFDAALPTEYSLGGNNWQSEGQFDQLSIGIYRVAVRNANAPSCETILQGLEVKAPFLPTISALDFTPLSDCGSEDGTITVSNDFSNSEFSLDNENWQSDRTFTGLSAGDYVVHIRNSTAPSCQLPTEMISIPAPDLPDIENVDITAPSQCGQADGTISIVTDEVVAYEYSIDGGENWQNTAEFTNLIAGNYLLQIRKTDSPSCLSELREVALSPSNPTDFGVNLTAARTTFCEGESLEFSVEINSGIAPYRIIYSDGSETFTLENYESGSPVSITPNGASTYEIISISDANNCNSDLRSSISFSLGGDECRFVAFTGKVTTEDGRAISGVQVNITGDMNRSVMTDEAGNYTLEEIDAGGNYQITVSYEGEALNGLSVFDLQLMSKHILDVQLLDSPYKIIAADVNNSGMVTTADIIDVRRILLGFEDTFPNSSVWKFIPADYEFTDPTNHFDATNPLSFQFNNVTAGVRNLDIIAIKVGDLNLSVGVE